MRIRHALLALICLSACWGCASERPVRFIDASINQAIPESFSDRTFLAGSGIERHWMERVVGYIYEMGSDERPGARVAVIEIASAAPEIKTVDEPSLFTAKLDSGFDADASVLGHIGQLDVNQISEVTISDVLKVQHPADTIEVLKALRNWAADKPDRRPGDYIFVDSAVLSIVEYRIFERVSSNAQLSALAFGAKGGVYQESGASRREYLVSVDGLDPAAVRANWTASPPDREAIRRLKEASRVRTRIVHLDLLK